MNGYFYDFILRPFEAFSLKNLRSRLLSNAHGRTLEIGIGTGVNLNYYPKDVQLIGIEPDESMRSLANKKAEHNRDHFQILDGDAQSLHFADSSFDTVVGTLVFCTIPNPDKALEEVYRVLKPGGSFLLLEHVRKNTPIVGRLLDLLTPAWKHVAGGCHLNRDPSKHIQEVGFIVDSTKTLWSGLGKIWYLRK